MLGGKATGQDVLLCQMSILSQCFHSIMARRRKIIKPRECNESSLNDLDIGEIADHVTSFSIDGIIGIKRRLENAKSGKKSKGAKF